MDDMSFGGELDDHFLIFEGKVFTYQSPGDDIEICFYFSLPEDFYFFFKFADLYIRQQLAEFGSGQRDEAGKVLIEIVEGGLVRGFLFVHRVFIFSLGQKGG